ncbi:MAG: NUDIX domain-containing protein [Jatrophihabitantaceae bacterium]
MSAAEQAGQATLRTAGRAFLIDDLERVLLIHDRVDIDATDSHWITPGGGIEDGETIAEAACREVYEETGLVITLPSDAPSMYTEAVTFTFAGKYVEQVNHYFLVRVASDLPVRPAANTDDERLVGLGHRWWPLAELDASDVTREPRALVQLLRRALAAS